MMTTTSNLPTFAASGPPNRNLFGIPLDRMGWFACLLLSAASGLLAFCVACFIAIFAVLFYNSFGHHNVDFAVTYKYIALPVGLAVVGLSLAYLGTLWTRRILRQRSSAQ